MTSNQSEGSDSTGSSGKQTDLEEATQHEPCDFCPFGASLHKLKNNYYKVVGYEAVKESAELGRCQACAGIVEFVNAQKLEPISSLSYRTEPSIGLTVVFEWADGTSSPYEFFFKAEEPAETFTLPDHSGRHDVIPRFSAPSGDTSSKAAFDTLKRWISQCETHHKLCQPEADKRLPHRVLEIESSEPLRIRLVENCTRLEKYACLSHRWGHQTGTNSLKKQNLDLYKTQIPDDKLYPLIRDAIRATIRLDIRFIWIDCYCIIQDDPKDWEIEAANMASIYENAFLTISATFSEGGCNMFSTMTRNFEAFQFTKIRGEPIFIRKRLPHPCVLDMKNENLDGPSLTRAWVFQERLLSNIFVHFTRDEIFWECRESTWCECDSRKDRWINQRKKKARTINDQDWDAMAQQYNETQLSFEKDRLPALAGVARRYAESAGGWTYLAGLWEEQLPAALAWSKGGYAEPRPLGQLVPTWSWASLPRGEGLLVNTSRWSSPSVRCEMKPTEAARDVYMSAEWTAEITVEGPALDLRVYGESEGFLVGRHENHFLGISADFKTDPDDDTTFRAVPDGSRCLLLFLFDHDEPPGYMQVCGIVLLQRNNGTDGEVPKFERIGHFNLDTVSYLDEPDEYAHYCGGKFPPWADSENHAPDSLTLEWLLERAKTRRVTLV